MAMMLENHLKQDAQIWTNDSDPDTEVYVFIIILLVS